MALWSFSCSSREGFGKPEKPLEIDPSGFLRRASDVPIDGGDENIGHDGNPDEQATIPFPPILRGEIRGKDKRGYEWRDDKRI